MPYGMTRTVGELRKFLSYFPDEASVWGYEGEVVGIIVALRDKDFSGLFDNHDVNRDELDTDKLSLKGLEIYHKLEEEQAEAEYQMYQDEEAAKAQWEQEERDREEWEEQQRHEEGAPPYET